MENASPVDENTNPQLPHLATQAKPSVAQPARSPSNMDEQAASDAQSDEGNQERSSSELDMIRSLLEAEKSKDPAAKEKVSHQFLRSMTPQIPEDAEAVAPPVALEQARAYSSEQPIIGEEGGTKVSRLLQRRKKVAVVVYEDRSVFDLVKELVRKRQSAALVRCRSNGVICGIVTDADVCRKLVAMQKDAKATQVKEIMTTKPLYVSPDTSILEVFAIMSKYRFRHLPILDSKAKKVHGLVDITHCLYDAIHRIEKVQQSQVEFVSLVQRSHVRWSSSTEDPANSRELARQMIDTLMKSISPVVSTIIDREKPFRIDSSSTVLEAAKLMTETRSTAIIGHDTEDFGIFTTKDLLSRVVSKGMDATTVTVKECMTTSPETCDESCNLLDALHLMHDGKFLHCPVQRDNSDNDIVGVLDVLDCAVSFFNKLNSGDRRSSASQVLPTGMSAEEDKEKYELSKLFFGYGNEDEKTITSSAYDGPDSISQFSAGEKEIYTGPLSVKLVTSDHTFRLSLEDDLSWEQFLEQIRITSKIDCSADGISLQYKDEDGDMIMLNSSAALQQARALARSQGWKKLDLVVKCAHGEGNGNGTGTGSLQQAKFVIDNQTIVQVAAIAGICILGLGWLFMNSGSSGRNRYDRNYYRR